MDARANIKQQTWTVGPFQELIFSVCMCVAFHSPSSNWVAVHLSLWWVYALLQCAFYYFIKLIFKLIYDRNNLVASARLAQGKIVHEGSWGRGVTWERRKLYGSVRILMLIPLLWWKQRRAALITMECLQNFGRKASLKNQLLWLGRR